MQSADIYQTYWDFRSVRIVFYSKTTAVKTNSKAISDSSNVFCFDLYLRNAFAKSTMAERWTDVMFKLTLYCLSVTIEDLNYNENVDVKI